MPAVAYRVPVASRVSGLSPATLYRCMADGSLPFRKCGRARLILASDLQAFLEHLPAA